MTTVTIRITSGKHGYQATIRQGRTRLMRLVDAESSAVHRRALAWCRHAGYPIGQIVLA
jgi:hypothetical protein